MAQGLLKLKHARETKAINEAHAKRMADGVAKLKIRLAAEQKSTLQRQAIQRASIDKHANTMPGQIIKNSSAADIASVKKMLHDEDVAKAKAKA